MNADTQGFGELLLGQPDESSKRDDILPSDDEPAENPLALFARDRPSKVLVAP